MATTSKGENILSLLLVINGLEAEKLSEILEQLKNDSKNIGSHKQRVLYWNAYSAIIPRLSSITGKVNAFITYHTVSDPDEDGKADIIELTKKQRHALAHGGLELMGKKTKSLDENSKGWVIVYGEDDAVTAWEDIHFAEPCIYMTSSAVFVGTRFKRKQCKSIGTCKTVKEFEKLMSEIQPSLQSIDWNKQNVPTINDYNTFICGTWSAAILGTLNADSIGHSKDSIPSSVYAMFLERRSKFFIREAERLIDLMLTDVNKGESKPLVSASSMKEAGIARKNSLMKKVFVHESKKVFIDNQKKDGGDVELYVITGNISGTRFHEYGGIVFEMFYRVDLSLFG
uniref:Uncharacterized protein n=3 Tax=Aplanochytrium stocchinoi TaxID=215587 RepID=A0A6S8EEA5_9STRA|mmetsp:Transcript_2090/g.2677  ORF Transcript_2090/g.2677 Transcript_2090/m.2677 type:complete len:342 (-) Transcript_2090:477-1502(-)